MTGLEIVLVENLTRIHVVCIERVKRVGHCGFHDSVVIAVK